MYQGFRLDVSAEELCDIVCQLYDNEKEHYEEAMSDYENFCRQYKKDVERYVTGGILKASRINDDWFPEIDADVFLSHSHGDKKCVVALAAWMYHNLNLKAFVDSMLWNYCDDLLRQMDKCYCVKEKSSDGTVFSYEKRNQSTAHVHIILNEALMKMIDKSECFMFIGTQNSLVMKPGDIEDGKYSTYSAWLSSEILTSRIIEKKTPDRLKDRITAISEGKMPPMVEYDLELSHLCKMCEDDILSLKASGEKGTNVLDILYENKKII